MILVLAGCVSEPLAELDDDDVILEGRSLRLSSAAGAVLEERPDRLDEIVAAAELESQSDSGLVGRGLLIAALNERFTLDRPPELASSDVRITGASDASVAALLKAARTADPLLRIQAYRCLANLADARAFSGLISLLITLAPRLDPSDFSAVDEARRILQALASTGRANGRYVRRGGEGGAAGALAEPWTRILSRDPRFEDPDRTRAAEEARSLAGALTGWASQRLPESLRGRDEES